MHCTHCGAEARGRFCAACGASLRALRCQGCGEQVAAGTRFCTACGTQAGAHPAGSPVTTGLPASPAAHGPGSPMGANMAWWVSGALLVALLVVVAIVEFSGSERDAQSFAATSGVAPNMDISSLTPREAADRLFNRVMEAAARDDMTEANDFLPMATHAYQMVGVLDDDGLFHLSLLQSLAEDHEAALATAREGLERNPDHLLNLSAAAGAARELGEAEAAEEYYTRMLAAWERELAMDRLEYREHEPLLPLIREDAEAFLAGAGP